MGEVHAKVRLRSLRGRKAKSFEAVVDTGATLSLFSSNVLRAVGIKPEGTLRIQLADGRIGRRRYGNALLQIDGMEVPAVVTFGLARDPSLVGVTVLEMACLMVDPQRHRLVRKRHYALYGAASGC